MIMIAVFLTMKLAGLHAIFHSDEKEGGKCDICEYSLVHSATPAIPQIEPQIHFETQKVEFFVRRTITNFYNVAKYTSLTYTHSFSRPPPTFS